MTEPQPIAEEIPNLEQVFWDELVVEIKEYHNEQMNAILNRPLPPAGRWVLSYNTLVSNQRMDFIKRLFIYLLLCFLVGKVVAEDIKTKSKDDLTDFIPAQSIIFFQ